MASKHQDSDDESSYNTKRQHLTAKLHNTPTNVKFAMNPKKVFLYCNLLLTIIVLYISCSNNTASTSGDVASEKQHHAVLQYSRVKRGEEVIAGESRKASELSSPPLDEESNNGIIGERSVLNETSVAVSAPLRQLLDTQISDTSLALLISFTLVAAILLVVLMLAAYKLLQELKQDQIRVDHSVFTVELKSASRIDQMFSDYDNEESEESTTTPPSIGDIPTNETITMSEAVQTVQDVQTPKSAKSIKSIKAVKSIISAKSALSGPHYTKRNDNGQVQTASD